MHRRPAPAFARPVNLPAAPDDAGSRLERLCSWPAAHVELVDLALAALLWLLTAAAYPVSYAGLPMGALEVGERVDGGVADEHRAADVGDVGADVQPRALEQPRGEAEPDG